MNALKYRTSIVFSRKSKSREHLKAFNKLCLSDKVMKRAYLGYSGRTFFFGFAKEEDLNSFKVGLAEMLEKINVKYELNILD